MCMQTGRKWAESFYAAKRGTFIVPTSGHTQPRRHAGTHAATLAVEWRDGGGSKKLLCRSDKLVGLSE